MSLFLLRRFEFKMLPRDSFSNERLLIINMLYNRIMSFFCILKINRTVVLT